MENGIRRHDELTLASAIIEGIQKCSAMLFQNMYTNTRHDLKYIIQNNIIPSNIRRLHNLIVFMKMFMHKPWIFRCRELSEKLSWAPHITSTQRNTKIKIL